MKITVIHAGLNPISICYSIPCRNLKRRHSFCMTSLAFLSCIKSVRCFCVSLYPRYFFCILEALSCILFTFFLTRIPLIRAWSRINPRFNLKNFFLAIYPLTIVWKGETKSFKISYSLHLVLYISFVTFMFLHVSHYSLLVVSSDTLIKINSVMAFLIKLPKCRYFNVNPVMYIWKVHKDVADSEMSRQTWGNISVRVRTYRKLLMRYVHMNGMWST